MSYRSVLTSTRGATRAQTTTHEGGVAFKVDSFMQLKRFLVLGSLSGSFYANGHDLTKENLSIVDTCLMIDPVRTVDMIVDVSDKGLAASNEPALLALAKAASFAIDAKGTQGADKIRERALSVLPQVARTGTHLLHFVDYVSTMRGWGTALRRHIGSWYLSKSPKDLAFQVTKYQSRDGWAHKDVLRLVHPKAPDALYDGIFNYVVNDRDVSKLTSGDVAEYLAAVNVTLSDKTFTPDVIMLIDLYRLPREVIATKHLSNPEVQAALLPHMPVHALLRNLGNMAKSGLLTPLSDAEKMVLNKLSNTRGMRLHPIDVLKAQRTYGAGYGMRGSGTWTPTQAINGRLEDLFYESFDLVTPTNKKLYLAIDVSGSMAWDEMLAPGLTPRTAAACLAMVTARAEQQYVIRGFSDKMVDLNIQPQDRLETVETRMNAIAAGWTLCNLPMEDAIKNNMDVDAFVIYTDSETGSTENPATVFKRFQTKMNKPEAKFIVNGMVANDISLADPNNPNMLDVVGFSSDTPAVMSAFIRGDI